MIETIQNFHFLRPAWLLLIPLCALFIYSLVKKIQHKESWQQVIDPKLLPFLSMQPSNKAIRWPIYCLGTAWLITTIALAGPTWKKVPQPVSQKHNALVVILDLSLSMYAQDIKPSRLIRAKYKINDLLKNRHEGLTGLIVYSGQAHAVTPLSDDSDTIINLLSALSPEIMPSFGSNPSAAIQQAIELFDNANISEGQILLITDGINSTDIKLISEQLAQLKYSLSILGVATENGAPIPINTGNGSEYLKDRNGNIVMPKLERGKLNALSKRVQGRYTDISLDNRDLDFLLTKRNNNSNTKTTERHFDTWHDSGALLALLLLPIAALAFRRGWLLMLPLLIIFETPTAHAFGWQDLWKTKDQQAMQMMQQEDFNNAASTFKNPAWQASANYKSGDYEQSLSQFEQLESSPQNLYNQANALAKMQNYEEAIKRYEQAITQQNDFTAAKENKALLEKLLEQQQQQSSQQQNGEQNKEQNKDSQQQGQNGNKQENQQASSEQQKDNNASQSKQQNEDNKQQSSQSNKAENEEALKDRAEKAQAEQQQSKENGKDKAQQLNQQQTAKQQREKQGQQESQKNEKANAQQLAKAQNGKQEQPIDHATEQWLRQIPDDPAGLLRRKFYYEYQMQNSKQRTTRESIEW